MDAEDPLYSDTRAFSQICSGCGRSFAQLNAFTNHSSSCVRKKRLFSSTLASAQEAYRKQKKCRLEGRQKLLSASDVQEKQPQVIVPHEIRAWMVPHGSFPCPALIEAECAPCQHPTNAYKPGIDGH